jgi:hypothetical protein
MTQPIWYDSTEAGAPTLNNVAGSLLEVLRSCLVTGFNAKTVTSIAVASGVATATCAAHGFLSTYGKLVQIAGAPEALLNGNQQPLTVATNTFTFAAPGVADGTYTGTISAKRAPLGWVEAHTGTNVAIFARSAPEATAQMLWVNDSHLNGSTTIVTRVRMVESATDANTFTGPAPTLAQSVSGDQWTKGENTATAKNWAIVGDGRFFYLQMFGYSPQPELDYFGDMVPYASPDALASVLAASGRGGSIAQYAGTSPAGAGLWVSGNVSGLSKSLAASQVGAGSGTAIGGSSMGTGPNVVLSRPVWLVTAGEATVQYVRGEVPGLASPLYTLPFADKQVVDFSGRKFLALSHFSGGQQGRVMIDLDGPWYA